MKYKVGDIIKIQNDAPLSGNTVAPPITIGDEHEVLHIFSEFEKGIEYQHLDIGIASKYNYITSWDTERELPDGDKIHWIHPSRVTLRN